MSIEDYAGIGRTRKYLPCTGLAMEFFRHPIQGALISRPNSGPQESLLQLPVGNWPDATFYPIGLAINNRQGAGAMDCMLIKLDVDSEDGMCTMACRIWLAAFTCRSGFHQRLVDPAALTVTGYTNARFPAIPSASLDLISPLTLPGQG